MKRDYFLHEKAVCESMAIGKGTRIWAFTHILPNAKIGTDCNICDFVFIENDVIVGDRVTIKSGVQLWDGLEIENDVFIGPNVTFTNDKFPVSRSWKSSFPKTLLKSGCSIGANSTILPGVTIGENSLVGAGSVVTRSIPPYALAYGNPARIHGYRGNSFPSADLANNSELIRQQEDSLLKDSMLPGNSGFHELDFAIDARGSLAALEFRKFSLFSVKRVFFVHNVPSNHVRGEHAHKMCSQFLIAISGTVRIVLDDGKSRKEIKLVDAKSGLYIPPLVWSSQYNFDGNTVLAVLASEPYDESDYIRDYSEFKQMVGT